MFISKTNLNYSTDSSKRGAGVGVKRGSKNSGGGPDKIKRVTTLTRPPAHLQQQGHSLNCVFTTPMANQAAQLVHQRKVPSIYYPYHHTGDFRLGPQVPIRMTPPQMQGKFPGQPHPGMQPLFRSPLPAGANSPIVMGGGGPARMPNAKNSGVVAGSPMHPGRPNSRPMDVGPGAMMNPDDPLSGNPSAMRGPGVDQQPNPMVSNFIKFYLYYF